MKKILLAILTIMLAATLLTGCGNKKNENDTLVVGMELAYPPFETKDTQGNPTGVSVDFANALGEYLGRSVKIENIAWDGLIPALQTGQVDVVISSMTIKDERREKIDFSKPYAKALLAILANKNSNVNSSEDLNQPGKKVTVKLNSTGHLYAQKNLANAQLITLADESACVTEVAQGKADAFIYDQLTIYRNNQQNPNTTKAIYIPFQSVEYWGVGIKKDNSDLTAKINEFIDKFYAEGGFDQLTEKYLAQEKKVFTELHFQWFFSDVNK
ncbi:MAG TPA: amino acid ABC transporter substrate-binding protein [Clostridiales bacterium]|nr:amino acid ABC transporter substrate-binding protein [Clostridiales bacterium]